MDLIITHAKCPDGLCAALIAKRRYPEAEVLFLDHGVPVPFEAVSREGRHRAGLQLAEPRGQHRTS